MADTPRYGLPLLDAGTADKSLGVNEALHKAEALLGGWAKTRLLATPPSSPAEGDVHLLPASGCTGAWAGQELKVAHRKGGAWLFYVPPVGADFRVEADSNVYYLWNGTGYVVGSGGTGLASVSADLNPALGNDLNGAGFAASNLRGGVEAFPAGLTAWTYGTALTGWLTGRPRWVVGENTAALTLTLPADAKRGCEFGLIPATAAVDTIVPASGATLHSASFGASRASVRSADPWKPAVFLCLRNNAGLTAAVWVAGGAHVQ